MASITRPGRATRSAILFVATFIGIVAPLVTLSNVAGADVGSPTVGSKAPPAQSPDVNPHQTGAMDGTIVSSGSGHAAAVPGGTVQSGDQASGSGIGTSSGDNLAYNGGPVMQRTTTYAIYWNPPGSTISSATKDLTQQFLRDLGGRYYGIMGQYHGPSGAALTKLTHFGGAWVDTANAYPHAGSASHPITDADIQQEVKRAYNANGSWNAPGLNTLYEVFLGQDIESCDPQGGCTPSSINAGASICAYHNHFALSNGTTVIYADNGDTSSGSACSITYQAGLSTPNDPVADSNVSLMSHETFESITDPEGNAWYVPSGANTAGEEIGDLCNFEFGPQASDGSDLVMSGHSYLVQEEWSNVRATPSSGGCRAWSGAIPQASQYPACTQNTLAANDDGSTGAVSLPFTVAFFNHQYSSLYVNNNGNVTFDGPQSTYTPYGLGSTANAIIAPYFADVDTRGNGSGVVTYGGAPAAGGNPAYFCVNWLNVGYYGSHTDRLNSFQLLLVDRSGETGIPGDFDIVFNYDKVQWETGDASGGSGGLGGTSAVVGYSNGFGDSEQLPGSMVHGALLDDSGSTPLIYGSENSTTEGNYVFPVRNGISPVGGTVDGTVSDSAGNLVRGAVVQVCEGASSTFSTTRCHLTQTDGAGQYSLTGLPADTYHVQVNPPHGSSLLEGFSSGALNPNGTLTLDVVLRGADAIPTGVTISHHRVEAGGVPVLEWSADNTLSINACPNAAVSAQITMDDSSGTWDVQLRETPSGSGTYSNVLPDQYPDHGPAQVVISVTCPGMTTTTETFSIYIDPSGTVVDTAGQPIGGATVTLLRSDSSTGPFVPVPDGSSLMSPANESNPDVTTSDGTFGWDVVTGYYEVEASKPGCTVPGNPSQQSVTSPVFSVPPPMEGLSLTLQCGDPTTITYTGPSVSDTGDPITPSASLVDSATGQPVGGVAVTLQFADQSCVATTTSAGVAACVVTPQAVAGSSTSSATFLGSPGLDGSSTTALVMVNLEEATATYTGPTSLASNVPVTLGGTLAEDGITPLAGRLLTFSVGTGASEQTCAATTDATGTAACIIVPNQALGATSVGVSFGGDARYQAAAASDSAIAFAWLESGAFVIGDAVSSIDTHVTFSSPQWCATNNPSSGCSASFKGFADGLATNPPLVGQSWTASPGNSGHAPTSVPPYMGVIVTSAASKHGNTISGTVEHLVVVAVDPGSSTSGTIVGVVA